MLNCKISKKIENAQCGTVIGGVRRLAVANWDASHSFTGSTEGCPVDTITLANNEKFYAIDFITDTAYFNCMLASGGNSDSKYLNHQAGWSVGQLTCDLIGEYKNWLLGKVVVAVEDKMGNTYIVGADNGLSALNLDFQSGSAVADASSVLFAYEGAQRNPLVKVSSWDVIAELLSDATEGGA